MAVDVAAFDRFVLGGSARPREPRILRDIRAGKFKLAPKRPGSKGAKKERKKPEMRAKEISIRSSDTAQQVIYGRFRVGGVISFVQDNASKESVTINERTGAVPSSRLHLVTTISGHEIDGVEEMYVDNERVVFGGSPDPRWAISGPNGTRSRHFANRIFMAVALGHEDQEANPDLVVQSTFFQGPFRWTAAHRQRGCAHIYTMLTGQEQAFPSGLPDLTWLVRGKKVLDTRDGVKKWTQNAALIIADYLTDKHLGIGIPWDKIDIPTLNAAANTCDELVPIPGEPGGYEGRYHLNGVFDTTMSHEDVLEEMLGAIAGDLVVQGGKYRILPGKPEPTSMTLDEHDLRGPISVSIHNGRKELFNAIKGKYVSPKTYEPVDFAPVRSAYYESIDGETRWEDVSLNWITQYGQARRIAKIELERNRQGIVVTALFSLRCYNLQVGDWIALNFAKYGWIGKLFEVREMALVYNEDQGALIEMTLTETDQGIYLLPPDVAPPLDISPNSKLPNPYNVPEPANVTLSSGTSELFIRGDGSVYTRLKVSWELPPDFAEGGGRVQVEYARSGFLNDWKYAGTVPAYFSYTHIADVADLNAYDVRVRAINGLGVVSDWVTVWNYTVVGKTQPPSDVSSFTATLDSAGILFEWSPIPDLDISHYIIKQGVRWDTSSFLAEVRGTSYRIGAKRAGGHTFLIKAVDTSRNESLNEKSLSIDVLVPSAPTVSWLLDGSDAVLSWTVPASSPYGIDSYDIYYSSIREDNLDPPFSEAVFLTSTKSLSYRMKASWGGRRVFWVAARDAAGNLGKEGRIEATITIPGPVQGLRAEVIDNNVLLRWSQSAQGTLPITAYRVFKGDAWPQSVISVGEVGGTFSLLFELNPARYTYWVVAVDSAGNNGTPTSVSADVNEPPDFVLKSNHAFDPTFAHILDNIYIQGVGFLFPEGDEEEPENPSNNNAGRPVGLLMTITHPATQLPPHNAGQPAGLLLAITKSDTVPPPAKTGVPQGLLLTITREE